MQGAPSLSSQRRSIVWEGAFVMYKVLIADDEEVIGKILAEEIRSCGCEVVLAFDGAEASRLCAEQFFHVVLLDIQMPHKDGLTILREIKRRNRATTVIIITAYGSIQSAVEAMKIGADDYITKPFDTAELSRKIEQHLRVKERMSELPSIGTAKSDILLGDHPSMRELKEKLEKIKDLNTTVLITGESGTGKGVIAKELHRLSARSHLPFVHVDCAFLPHNLIESELFGYEKGAFTGANATKKGKFELAGRGTIFLDEIGTLPLSLQAKLLIVLQEHMIDRVGGTKKVPIEARIIAATNEDLEENVKKGLFREDLYYRLNVVRLQMPALRYRKSDIPALAQLFIAQHARNMNKTINWIDDRLFDYLKGYDWPGNVRELENALESAIALCDGERIQVEDLPIRICTPREVHRDTDSGEEQGALSLEQQEIIAIAAALERNNGHRENTAKDLGISRRTLQYKLRRFNLI